MKRPAGAGSVMKKQGYPLAEAPVKPVRYELWQMTISFGEDRLDV